MRQAEVARLLGVSRQAVGQWHAAWREGGRGHCHVI
ncbi:helix-turn-helix domain-containing protein [Streptomyces sp. NBC_01264]|nr:helix-turn-helix domain-containing protein [Streptomyces sp. NBC_01264]MCX4784432.1 helix-turn-helix domain-containing protein [Streptomyces sp. NBC_01264]